jgi:hypothetical protein
LSGERDEAAGLPGPRVQIDSANVSWREVDGSVVALNLRSSTYVATNQTGTLIWQAMVDGCSFDDLVGLLCSTFGVSRLQAEADVSAFLHSLSSNALLVQP